MAPIGAQAQQTKWIHSGKADIEATLRGIYAASKEKGCMYNCAIGAPENLRED